MLAPAMAAIPHQVMFPLRMSERGMTAEYGCIHMADVSYTKCLQAHQDIRANLI